MRIIIIGAGAMGSLFGGRLRQAGHDLLLIDTNQTLIDHINASGLYLLTADAEMTVTVPATAAARAEPGCDLVILFTKTFHSAAALASCRHIFGPETRVMTLQNGLGTVERIEPLIPRSQIIAGVTTIPADSLGPGRVKSVGRGEIRLMSADGRETARLQAIATALAEAQLPCTIDPDVERAIWEKVAFNTAFNSICAVTGATPGAIADSEYGRSLVDRILEETVSVACAKGVSASLDSVRRQVEMAMLTQRDHQPSMLQDLLAGRPTEIDALNGSVAREAAKLGLSVPVTTALWHLVNLREHVSHQSDTPTHIAP